MSNRTTLILVVVLTLAAFAAGALAYSFLPERVAAHWNAQGQVDGYSSPFTAAFLFPILTLAIAALLMVIPLIDPLKANIRQFRPSYNLVIVATTVYLVYIYALTLFHTLVRPINMVLGLVPGFALLDLAMGYVLGQARQNWFIGIRTPWTLSNRTVWEKTHRLGSVIMYISAGLALIGLLVPEMAIFFLVVPLLAMGLITVVYSFVVYQQEMKQS